MKSYVVIGCGRFGSAVAKTLFQLGNEVLAVDISEESVREIAPYVSYAAELDVMNEDALKNLGIQNCDVAVVAIASDLEASVMATVVAKELGIPKVLAKAKTTLQAKVLKKIGADAVVFPERDMGVRIANNLSSGNILDYIELSDSHSIMEILPYSDWIDRSLSELRLPNNYGLNIIAIKRGDEVIITPKAEEVLRKKDILVMVGAVETLQRFTK